MNREKKEAYLEELAKNIFNNEFVDSILAEIYRDNYQFIRVRGDRRAYLLTRRLIQRAKEIEERSKQCTIRLKATNGDLIPLNPNDFNFFFFPYIIEEEAPANIQRDILRSSYDSLRNSFCEKNQRLIMVLVDYNDKEPLKEESTKGVYDIEVGWFIQTFEKQNSQSLKID